MKVIAVRGGLVQSVYSDTREEIYVFDYDGDDPKEDQRYRKEAARLIKTHRLVEIY